MDHIGRYAPARYVPRHSAGSADRLLAVVDVRAPMGVVKVLGDEGF